MLRKLPLYNLQKSLKPVFGNYAGYNIPMNFGINKTSNVVRNIRKDKTTVFDVSHMGIIRLKNNCFEQNNKLLERVFPINTDILKRNKSKLSILFDKNGFIKDDLIISNINNIEHRLIVNAATKYDILQILQKYNENNLNIELNEEIILAIQGKYSQDLLNKMFDINLNNLDFNDTQDFYINNNYVEIARTGYTGEDGFEIYCDLQFGKYLYQKLISNYNDIQFGGLIERDILRLEAGFCLSGNEFGQDKNILFSELNMNFLIGKKRRNDKSFIGGDKFDLNSNRIRIGIYSSRPLKQGDTIYCNNQKVGFITSSTKSFSLDKFISMGYIDKNSKELYTIKNNKKNILEITPLPFIAHKLKKN